MKSLLLYFFVLATFTVHAQKRAIKFNAHIQNRNSDTLYIIGRPPENFKQIIAANPDGDFSATFSAKTDFYVLLDGKERTTLFLKKGYDITMTMDANQFDETLHFEGNGAAENNFLIKKFLDDEAFEKQADLLIAKPSALKALIYSRTEKLEDELDKLKVDRDFREGMEQQIESQKRQLLIHAEEIEKNMVLENNFIPQFNYENYNGGTSKPADFKGKYVYIDVWATWCAPCRAEIPYLKKLQERYKGRNITFVSISIDNTKDRSKWKKFITDQNLEGIQLLADNAWESEFIQEFGIRSIPRFILIFPNGTVLNASAYKPRDPELEKQLDSILLK